MQFVCSSVFDYNHILVLDCLVELVVTGSLAHCYVNDGKGCAHFRKIVTNNFEAKK